MTTEGLRPRWESSHDGWSELLAPAVQPSPAMVLVWPRQRQVPLSGLAPVCGHDDTTLRWHPQARVWLCDSCLSLRLLFPAN